MRTRSSAHDPAHRDGRVVVAGADRHAAEEREPRYVGRLEGLGALAGIGGEEVGVRIRQGDDPEGRLAPDSGDLDHRLAEVELGMAGRMAERDEGFLRIPLGLGHRHPDLGDPTAIAVLVAQSLEDASTGVALLGRSLLVGLEDLVDDVQELAELGLRAGFGHPVAGRLGVDENLVQDLGADLVVPADRALGDALHQDLAADLRPFVHVGSHLSPVLLVRSGTKPASGVEQI